MHCVWDQYGEEVEEWAAKWGKAATKTATKTGEKPREGEVATPAKQERPEPEKGLDSALFKDVPVGILEFMKQERRLKEAHRRREGGGE